MLFVISICSLSARSTWLFLISVFELPLGGASVVAAVVLLAETCVTTGCVEDTCCVVVLAWIPILASSSGLKVRTVLVEY